MSKKKEIEKTHYLIKKANKILKKEGMKFKKGTLIRSINGKEKEVSNFIVIPLRRIKSKAEDKDTHYIELKIFAGKIELDTHLVEAMEVEKMYYLSKYWGSLCNIYPDGGGYKYVLFALKLLLKETNEIHQFTKIGWQELEKDKMGYVLGNTVIGARDTNFIIHNDIKKYVLHQVEISEKQAFEFYLKLLKVADDEIVYPLISHLMVGMLFQLFKESNHEIDFVLMLSGHTGALKTTLAYLIGNIFNKGGSFKQASFTDTVNDLEMFVSEMSCCVSIIDDLHPSVDPVQNRSLESKAQRIIRNVGDGNGKGRLKQDLTRHVKYLPKSAVLFTGEFGISGASSIARMYTINMTRNNINFKWLNYVQNDEVIISSCIYNFLEWIAPRYKDIVGFISERYSEIKKQIFKELEGEEFHFRKPKIATCYLLGLEIFMSYGVSIGAITEKN